MGVFTNVNGVIREAKDIYVNQNNVIRKVKSGRVGPGLAVPGQPYKGIPQTRSYFEYEFNKHNVFDSGLILFLIRQVRPNHQNLIQPGALDERLVRGMDDYIMKRVGASGTMSNRSYGITLTITSSKNNYRYQYQVNMYLIDNSNPNDIKLWAVYDSPSKYYDEEVYDRPGFRKIYNINYDYFRGLVSNKYKNIRLTMGFGMQNEQYGSIKSQINFYIKSKGGWHNDVENYYNKYMSFLSEEFDVPAYEKCNAGWMTEWKFYMGVHYSSMDEGVTNSISYRLNGERVSIDGKEKMLTVLPVFAFDDWDNVDPVSFPVGLDNIILSPTWKNRWKDGKFPL